MSVIENSKLTVVGAGSVGASVAYAALIRGSARHVALYDIAAEKVEAEVLDLAHGTQFTGSSDITGGSDVSVAAGSHVVVITAGAKQNPGQTRTELAATKRRDHPRHDAEAARRRPARDLRDRDQPVRRAHGPGSRGTGLPSRRIFASGTVLDTSRLRWKLAQRAGVATSSVHAWIVGEHGDTEFPLWSTATIGSVPITEFDLPDGTRFDREQLDAIAVDVRDAAYKVIKGKGATNYAIGLSSARIVEAILRDEHAILPVSTVLQGFHGVNGMALSVALDRLGARSGSPPGHAVLRRRADAAAPLRRRSDNRRGGRSATDHRRPRGFSARPPAYVRRSPPSHA